MHEGDDEATSPVASANSEAADARCDVCDCIIDKKQCAVCASIDCKNRRGSALTPHVRFDELRGQYNFFEILMRKGVEVFARQ